MNDESTGRSWRWTAADGTASNDWTTFRDRLLQLAAQRRFVIEDLGPVGGEPLYLLQRATAGRVAPHLLLASGFHGEEPAGPWGVLAFLAAADEALLSTVSLAVLPLVNVTGFRAGRRFNDWGENPNRGFLAGNDAPSREGSVLLNHGERLDRTAADGLLTCHEDVLLSGAYLYGLERSALPGAFSRELLAASARFVPLHPDGEVDGCPVREGIVFNHRDTSFETWLFERGARRGACVETPGQQPFDRRIAAQAAMMRRFVELAAIP